MGEGVWAPEQISIPSTPPFRHLQALQPKAVLSGAGGGEWSRHPCLDVQQRGHRHHMHHLSVMVKHLTAFTEVIMSHDYTVQIRRR